MPLDIIFDNPADNAQSHCQYTLNLRRTLEQAYKLARKNMGTLAYRQKELYDRKVHGEKFQVGQLVWLCNPVIPRGGSRKLHSPWVGPYKIVKSLADTVYRIQDTRTSWKRIVIHFDRLKPCHPGMRTQEDRRSTMPHSSEDVIILGSQCHLEQTFNSQTVMMIGMVVGRGSQPMPSRQWN